MLDNLTAIFQGQQSRAYVYDSLGRLKTATTPESGAVNYTYNDSGTTATRTDARGVITNYAYDSLNRLHQLSYTTTGTTAVATPSVTFTYGTSPASYNNGRLSSMSDGLGGEAYGYDRLGRMIALTKTIGATNYPLAYAYNLASELTSITYPSGRVVAQTFDNIGRLSQITSSSVNYLTVAASSGYNTANEVLSATYGNGVAATFGYNARLQLASLAYAKSGSNLFSLTYNYGTGNNGQIQSITDNGDNGRTINYSYDAWSRLKTAATVGSTAYPAWGLSWSYDRYGNRKQQTVTAGSNMPSNSVAPSPTTNRITDAGYAYDLAGNMTNDGSNMLTYDSENRVTNSVNGGASGAYAFDGNSLRVQKTVAGATTLYIFSGSKVIAEYASGAAPSSPTREYIYSSRTLLAKIEGSTTRYYHPDHLSNRVGTDSTGTAVEQLGHFSFGETWYDNGSEKWKFTSYERDSESGNDYAMMRTSVNRLGRFSSPDPLAGNPANPQSLNRYAYALNRPSNLSDPSGLRPTSDSGIDWLLSRYVSGCHIDGFLADCGMANAMLQGSFGVQCPNNACVGWNRSGQPVKFWAFAGGGSGYYSQSGPGALYYSRDAAMGAAGLADAQATAADPVVREYYSLLIEDSQDGVFTFASPVGGEPCTEMPGGQFDCKTFFPSAVASNVFGIAHSHVDDTIFSGKDENTYNDMNIQLQRPFWGVLAPVGIPGWVLVFDPVTWTECVLLGPTNSLIPNRCH
jgi:RHS repeat-associated protein